MATLGQDLKRERELRSITIQDIASATKIIPRYFEALEADRWNDLPGPFFIKGVIRAYCKAIGADENAYVNKYHQEVLFHEAEEVREAKRPSIRRTSPPSGRRIGIRILPLLAVLAAIAALAAAALLLFGGGPDKPMPAVPKPAAFEAPRLPAPPVPDPSGLVQKAEPEGLKLEFVFLSDTWIHLSADGRLVLEGIQKAGERASFSATSEFVLQTGNAGGFEWTINGSPAHPLGIPGDVRTDIRINRGNSRSFLRDEPEAPGEAGG
jgi:cytoskeletal protein RodZ